VLFRSRKETAGTTNKVSAFFEHGEGNSQDRHDDREGERCAAALAALSALHDFVLGPRLALEVREGREPSTRPLLVAVGRAAFAFTVVVPVLGVALTVLEKG